jgi:hypothetical protein
VITEKRFASSHHAFWRELLPMGEHYIREVNQQLARFEEPLASASMPKFHGIVNELAFRLFIRATTENLPFAQLTDPVISSEISQTVRFIESFRQHGRGPLPPPGQVEIEEALLLVRRLHAFFQKGSDAPLLVQPAFPGCGWLSECQGDVLSSGTLYEIKAGARAFRMLDVKQVLVYCALNFASKRHNIRDVCLLNPREGMYFSETLNRLCELIAGRSAVDVLGEIVEYVSEANGRYGTG